VICKSSRTTGPEGYRRFRLPEFLDSRYMKVAKMSALRTDRLYPPGDLHGFYASLNVIRMITFRTMEWDIRHIREVCYVHV